MLCRCTELRAKKDHPSKLSSSNLRVARSPSPESNSWSFNLCRLRRLRKENLCVHTKELKSMEVRDSSDSSLEEVEKGLGLGLEILEKHREDSEVRVPDDGEQDNRFQEEERTDLTEISVKEVVAVDNIVAEETSNGAPRNLFTGSFVDDEFVKRTEINESEISVRSSSRANLVVIENGDDKDEEKGTIMFDFLKSNEAPLLDNLDININVPDMGSIDEKGQITVEKTPEGNSCELEDDAANDDVEMKTQMENEPKDAKYSLDGSEEERGVVNDISINRTVVPSRNESEGAEELAIDTIYNLCDESIQIESSKSVEYDELLNVKKTNESDLPNIDIYSSDTRDDISCHIEDGASREGNTGIESEKEEDTNEIDSQGTQFCVGHFLWGKIKSHPWWPGQVCDPSNASDYAKRLYKKGKILVAYFGDATFAWCKPSQLMSFHDNFMDMYKQSNTKAFTHAVEEALNEIDRCIRAEFSCQCVPEHILLEHSRPLAFNAGIKEGILVPEGNISEFSINNFEPRLFLDDLRDLAVNITTSDYLQFTVLKSRLAAFYHGKGYQNLITYSQYEGIEENIEEPNLGEIDWLTLSNSGKNELHISEEKLYQRRKKRSMTELLTKNTNSQLCSTNGTSEKKLPTKSISSRGKRKLPEKFGLHNDIDVSGGTTGSPRERKRSKYLSPPYTSEGQSGTLSFSLDVTDVPVKIKRVHDNGAETRVPEVENGSLMDSPLEKSKSRVSHGKKNEKRLHSSGSCNAKENGKKSMSLFGVSLTVKEAFIELLSVALDPFYLKGKRAEEDITSFFILHRSSLYEKGSNFETYRTSITNSRNAVSRKKRIKSEARTCDTKEEREESSTSHVPTCV